MQKSIGDIVTIELPEINHHIDQLDSVATIEATKTVVEVLAPFSGTIIAINSGLQNEPERINQSPYQMGWICVIPPSDTNSEIENLLTPSAYFEEMKVKVEENAHKTKV